MADYRTSYHFKNRIEIVEETSGGILPDDKEEKVFTKAWADIRTMKGTEYNMASHTGNVDTSRFIIRYKKGIRHDMKIIYKGLKYEIESITNDNEDNYTLTIIAKVAR